MDNFATCLKMHLLFYRDVNLGFTTNNPKKRKGKNNGSNESKGTCGSKVATNRFRVINDKEEDDNQCQTWV